MNNYKIHFWWTVAFGILLLLNIITFWLGGKGNEIVSYISFGGTLISIILALVAIFYCFIQNANSQQNIGEMKSLISEASRIITEKAYSMEQHTSAISRMMQSIAQKTETTLPASPTPFYLNVSYNSHLGLLAFYALTQSHKHSKTLFLKKFLSQHYPSPAGQDFYFHYCFGFFASLTCFLETGSVAWDLDGWSIKVNKLPADLEEYVVKHINERVAKATEESMQIFLKEGKLAIDTYFAAV